MSTALATHKVAATLATVALVLGLAFAFAAPAKADTLTDLQAQVQALLAQIATLQGGSTTTGGTCTGFTFTANYKMGQSGSEVMQIQKFLNANGFTVATSGAGSAGNETSYFGAATKAAVIKFQNANAASILTPVGLTTGTGNWYASTRAKANMMGSSCTGGTGTTPTGAGLSVAAAAQPTNSLAPQGASRVPFTKLTLTNNSGAAVTVNGITVERTGLGQNAVFSGIVLVDDTTNTQVGTSKTLNSNYQAVVGDTFTVNPGETKRFTIAGNMATPLTSYAGQVVGLSVVGVNTSATVSGSLPITGAYHTVNASLSIGTVSTSTSAFDPGTNTQKNIGDTAVRFSGVRFTAGSAEDLRLYSVRWRQVGTASAVDISNVMTYVDGTAYPTTVSVDGKYYTTSFPGGIMVAKGNSVDVYAQGDLTGSNSASRTVDFDIDRVTDVYFVGQLYGYGVAPSGTYTPWYNGFTTTINAGTVTTIGKANQVASQNIAPNVMNQPLGGFVTNFAGEGVSVSQMVFTYATSSAAVGQITNASIVDENGVVVAGPVDATSVASTGTLTFSDTVTFPVGSHVYTIKGKLPSTAGNGAVVTLSTTPSGWSNPTGQTSGNTVTISTGSFSMNPMTVRAGSLVVSASTQPAAQSIVAGVQGFTFANIQLDASQSGEDVRVNSVPVYYANTSGTLAGYFSGCQLWDGATALNTGSNVVNTITTASNMTFTFNNSLIVPKGTVKTLAVKCNLSTSAAGAGQFGVNGGTYTGYGVTSGTTISGTTSTTNSGVMTVSTGSFAVTVAPSSPSYAVVAGGAMGVNAGVVNLRASNEDVSLTKLGVTLTGGATSNHVTAVHIYNGATEVGVAYFTGSNTSATSTLSTPVTLVRDTDVTLTLKADLATISSSGSGTAGQLVKVDPLNAEGIGASSGSTIQVGATAGVAGFRTYRSFPKVALVSLGSTGMADGLLIRFSVTADAAGAVGMESFGFTLATTTASITNIGLYGYTNSSFSSPISGQGTSGQIGSTVASTGAAEFKIGASSNAVQVPAGSTYYFELRGSVSGATTGASVVTTLAGDTAAAAIAQAAAATSSDSFVWAGNSTTTSGFYHADWANGYGIDGLPASGLIQTRSN
jgi:hypothetical protein